MTIKFMWNGIKIDGKLYKVSYSTSILTAESGYPEGTITIYGKERLPAISCLTIHNDSDIMTDYFASDTIRVTPDNAHYAAVKQAVDKMNEHYNKRFQKKYSA